MFGCSRSGGACRLAEGHGPSSDSERAALAAIAKVAPYAGAPVLAVVAAKGLFTDV